MLSTQQQQLIQAIQELDVLQVQHLLQQVDPNFLTEDGPPVSILCDRLFVWWTTISDGYEAGKFLSEAEKQEELAPYLVILEALIAAKANVHLWDSETLYGPLWDAASAACAVVVKRLLDERVNPNTLDEEGDTILTSISRLFFDCDYDEIDWTESYPEEKRTLHILREHGAKMTKELTVK